MSSNENTTMSDKLFDLCKKQLHSVIDEAGNSILKLTQSSTLAVKDSAELIEVIAQSKLNRKNETDLCSSLEDNVNEILVSMQFFDELSQRIEHIMEIVDLIKVESSREGCSCWEPPKYCNFAYGKWRLRRSFSRGRRR